MKKMKRCALAGAVVYHGLSKIYSPTYGNALLIKELKKSQRFFGCWVLLPHHLRDFPEPE